MSDIVDVVGERVELVLYDQTYVGRCPFFDHPFEVDINARARELTGRDWPVEMAPAFRVRVRPGTFHCFACGTAGTADDFPVGVV